MLSRIPDIRPNIRIETEYPLKYPDGTRPDIRPLQMQSRCHHVFIPNRNGSNIRQLFSHIFVRKPDNRSNIRPMPNTKFKLNLILSPGKMQIKS